MEQRQTSKWGKQRFSPLRFPKEGEREAKANADLICIFRHLWLRGRLLRRNSFHFHLSQSRLLPDLSVNDFGTSGRTGAPSMQADRWVASMLKDGYFLPFEEHPSPVMLVLVPLYLRQIHKIFTPQWSYRGSDISRSVFFNSQIILTPKKTGEWRPVIVLSTLNWFV